MLSPEFFATHLEKLFSEEIIKTGKGRISKPLFPAIGSTSSNPFVKCCLTDELYY